MYTSQKREDPTWTAAWTTPTYWRGYAAVTPLDGDLSDSADRSNLTGQIVDNLD